MPVSILTDCCVLWLNNHPTAKMTEEVNRKCLLGTRWYTPSALYTEPECHKTLSQTDRETKSSYQ